MMFARSRSILFGCERFWYTTLVGTNVFFPISCHHWFLLFSFLCFGYFSLLCSFCAIEIICCWYFFLLLIFKRILSIFNCVWFRKFCHGVRWIIWVSTNTTSFYLFKLSPIVRYLIATRPSFLKIMENWFPTMEITLSVIILIVSVLLLATWSFTLFHLFRCDKRSCFKWIQWWWIWHSRTNCSGFVFQNIICSISRVRSCVRTTNNSHISKF